MFYKISQLTRRQKKRHIDWRTLRFVRFLANLRNSGDLVQQIKAIRGMELRAPSVCDYFGACVPSMAAKLNPQGVSTSVTQKREETSWWVTADQTRPEEEEEEETSL